MKTLTKFKYQLIVFILVLLTILPLNIIGVCKNPNAMKCPKMVTYINVTTLIAIGIILISVAIVKNEVIQNLITGSLSIITGGLNFIWANHWVCKVDTMICRTTTSPIMKVIAFVWIGYGVFLVVKTILAKSKNMPFQS